MTGLGTGMPEPCARRSALDLCDRRPFYQVVLDYDRVKKPWSLSWIIERAMVGLALQGRLFPRSAPSTS
jgi:hypothetical protein